MCNTDGKAAHTSGDYTELLKAASVEEVKTEQKTRRIKDVVQQAAAAATDTNQDDTTREGANVHGLGPDEDGGSNPDYVPEGETDAAPDEQTTTDETAVPGFLKKGKAMAA